MSDQHSLSSDQSDTPKTDAEAFDSTIHGPNSIVKVEFARDQERRIAAHIALMIRLKDHMERMGFCTREEEPYLEELEQAITEAMQP